MKIRNVSGKDSAGGARANESQALIPSSWSRVKAFLSEDHSEQKVVTESSLAIISAKLDGKVTPNTEEITVSPRARRTGNSQKDLSAASANSDGQDKERTIFDKEGILVDAKDGRAAAGGNELKTIFPNNYSLQEPAKQTDI